jgi:hypothetical protein
MPFVLKRTDQGGGYVALPGSKHSYTKKLEQARQYPTKDAAEGDRCPDNEIVLDYDSEVAQVMAASLFPQGRRY